MSLRRVVVGSSFLLLLFSIPANAQWPRLGQVVTSAVGTDLFTSEGSVVVPDGAGGVFAGWTGRADQGGEIRVQRLDAAGEPLWTPGGVLLAAGDGVNTDARNTQVVADGTGGVLVAWHDDIATGGSPYDVRVQRLDGNGNVLWTPGGIDLTTVGANATEPPRIVAGPAGAAFVAWTSVESPNIVVRVQRISAAGNVLGPVGGATPLGTSLPRSDIDLRSDGIGTIFLSATTDFGDDDVQVAWFDLNSTSTDQIFSVLTNLVPSDENQGRIVPDGSGGVYLVYLDSSASPVGVRAMHFQSNGVLSWTTPPLVSSGDFAPAGHGATLEPSTGDLFVWWGESRSTVVGTEFDFDVYVQRVGRDGGIQWDTGGLALTNTTGSLNDYSAVATDDGGLIAAWSDGSGDLRVQRVSPDGRPLWAANGRTLVARTQALWPRSLVTTAPGELLLPFIDITGTIDLRIQRVDPRHGYWGRPEPVLVSVDDTPNDQGGFLRATWTPSDHDVLGESTISHYSVWRSIEALPRLDPDDVRIVDSPAEIELGYEGVAYRSVGSWFWEYVGQQPSGALPGYSFNVPTAANEVQHAVQVVAHTFDIFVTFPSTEGFGTSIDNLAPAAPLALVGQRIGATEISLEWLPSGEVEPDFATFEVYRSTGTGFDLATATRVVSTSDVVALDADASSGVTYTYAVVAVDVNGNVSETSNLATISGGATSVDPAASVTRLALRPNAPNPFASATRLRFGLPQAGPVEISVFDLAGRRVRTVRQEMSAGWHDLPFEARDENGRDLTNGIYMLRLRAGDQEVSGRISVLR